MQSERVELSHQEESGSDIAVNAVINTSLESYCDTHNVDTHESTQQLPC